MFSSVITTRKLSAVVLEVFFRICKTRLQRSARLGWINLTNVNSNSLKTVRKIAE